MVLQFGMLSLDTVINTHTKVRSHFRRIRPPFVIKLAHLIRYKIIPTMTSTASSDAVEHECTSTARLVGPFVLSIVRPKRSRI